MNQSLIERSIDISQRLQDILFSSNRRIKKKNRLKDVLLKSDYSLKDGLAGICLLFLELFHITKKRKYLNVSKRTLKQIMILLSKDKSNNYGFMKGRAGISFLLLRFYQVTKDKQYLIDGKQILATSNIFLSDARCNNSLSEGRAGVLWVLMALLQEEYDHHSKEIAVFTLRLILHDAIPVKKGLQWFHSQTQLGGISSWGYGALGVGYVLDLASKVFDNSELKAIAKMAFRFCDSQWDETSSCWRNNYLEIENQGQDEFQRRKYGKVRNERLGESRFDLVHGMAGMLIGSINAGYCLNPKHFRVAKKNLEAHFESTTSSTITDLSALHLILNEPSTLPNKSHKTIIKRSSSSPGIHSGSAGVAYYYLIKSGLIETPFFSFVFRRPISENHPKRNDLLNWAPKDSLGSYILMKYFFRTFSRMGKDLLENSISRKLPPDKCVSEIRKIVRKSDNEITKEAFKLEHLVFNLSRDGSYDFHKTYIEEYEALGETLKLQKIVDAQLLKIKFKLHPTIITKRTRINVSKEDFGQSSKKEEFERGDFYFQLKWSNQEMQVTEKLLKDLDVLLVSMRSPTSGLELINQITRQFQIKNQKRTLAYKIADFIRRNVLDCVLVRN